MPDESLQWMTAQCRPPQRWQLAIPPTATLEDVIGVLNDAKITFTDFGGEGEAAPFRAFGPSAVHFRRIP